MRATVCSECDHNIVVTDGENVCMKCGFVDSTPDVDDSSIYDTSPVPPLYLSQSIGTGNEIPKSNENAAMRKFFKGGLSPHKNLSCFSNACLKLEIPKHVEQEAWSMFLLISRAMPQKIAEHACIAIFHTCRKNGSAKTDAKIINAIKASFGRKTLPTMTKMTYQHMHVIDYDTARTNEDRYYFNVVLHEKTLGLNIADSVWARCEKQAWYLYTEMYDYDDNYKRRARMAIEDAFMSVHGFGRRVK